MIWKWPQIVRASEGAEVLRIAWLVRDYRGDDLLGEIFDEVEITAARVLELRAFTNHFHTDTTREKVVQAVDEYFRGQGVMPPAEEAKPYVSVLDEMDAEENIMTKKLEAWCKARGREYRRADGSFDPVLAMYCKDPDFRRAVDKETEPS